MKLRDSGFSLIELLITIAVLAVVSGAAISMIYQSQFTYTAQTRAAESANNVRAAMEQIVRTIRQAGSDPHEALTVPAVSILGAGYVQLASDLTGSVPSVTGDPMEATGDPDGTLSSLGEVVTFRYDSSSENLFMDMGYGESVLAGNITDFTLSYFDGAGNPTTVDEEISLVKIDITGKTEEADPRTGLRNAVSLSAEVFVRSRTSSLF